MGGRARVGLCCRSVERRAHLRQDRDRDMLLGSEENGNFISLCNMQLVWIDRWRNIIWRTLFSLLSHLQGRGRVGTPPDIDLTCAVKQTKCSFIEIRQIEGCND